MRRCAPSPAVRARTRRAVGRPATHPVPVRVTPAGTGFQVQTFFFDDHECRFVEATFELPLGECVEAPEILSPEPVYYKLVPRGSVSPPPPHDDGDGDGGGGGGGGVPIAAVAGGVAGGAVLLIAVAVGVFCMCRKKPKKQGGAGTSQNERHSARPMVMAQGPVVMAQPVVVAQPEKVEMKTAKPTRTSGDYGVPYGIPKTDEPTLAYV